MTEQLAIIRKSNLRVIRNKTFEEISSQISELNQIIRIAEAPFFQTKAKRYYEISQVLENPEAPSELKALFMKEAREILALFPEGRRKQAFEHAVSKLIPFLDEEEYIAEQKESMKGLFVKGTEAEKYLLECELKEIREAVQKNHWDIYRVRRCEYCTRFFEVKRTDQKFCMTNCRVQSRQLQKGLA